MKDAIVALILSAVSAAYWWIVFLTVYADVFFAGNSGPGWQPMRDTDAQIRAGAILLIGVQGYAGLIWMAHRLADRRRR
jgi:hypothetical protein